MLAHGGSFDCWDFLSNIVGSLSPYSIKGLEVTFVVNWHFINSIQLNGNKMVHLLKIFCEVRHRRFTVTSL